MRIEPLTAWDEPAVADGCAYIIENGSIAPCGKHCLPGSSYCLVHHELCYLPRGSKREARKISEFNRLAGICDPAKPQADRPFVGLRA